MDDQLEREIDAAEALGRQLLDFAPLAHAASFDKVRRRIIVELTDGRAYAFPVRTKAWLERARSQAALEASA